MTNQVPQIILQQLGGNKFLAMTGCTNLATNGNDLTMKLRRNISKATHLQITLNGSDLYDIKFLRCNMKTGLTVIKEVNNAYSDMLQKVFTSTTGMYTSL